MTKKWPSYLTDDNLSLHAKGLYAIIDMQMKLPQPKFDTKMIESWISDGGKYIERALRELVKRGYLQQRAADDSKTITIYDDQYEVAEP